MTKTHLLFEFEKKPRKASQTSSNNKTGVSTNKAKLVKNAGTIQSNPGPPSVTLGPVPSTSKSKSSSSLHALLSLETRGAFPFGGHFREKSLHGNDDFANDAEPGPSGTTKVNSSPVASTSRDPRLLLRTTGASPPDSPGGWSVSSPTVVIDIEPSRYHSPTQELWAWPRNANEDGPSSSSSPVARHRLAQRQRKIVPVKNKGTDNGILTKTSRKTISKRKCWSAIVSKCFPTTGESSIPCCNNSRENLRKLYRSCVKKKREWDRWNPSKYHPIVSCIDESKFAGLKETIKPNRGIIYRYDQPVTNLSLSNFYQVPCQSLSAMNVFKVTCTKSDKSTYEYWLFTLRRIF
jgi:hypothetical protein